MQDMKSIYVDIKESMVDKENKVDGLQIDLLKIDEINLDYILALIFEKSKENNDVESLKSEVLRVIRSSLGTRSKEALIIDFINNTEISNLKKMDDVLELFYNFAKEEKNKQIAKLAEEEKLKEDKLLLFIQKSFKKGFVEYAGDELDSMITSISRIGGERWKKKEIVLTKIRNLVDIFEN